MTSQLSSTKPPNSDTELPLIGKRKQVNSHNDPKHTQKKTRTAWDCFQTLKLTELLTTEFADDTLLTMHKQNKWNVLLKRFNETTGLDRSKNQIYRKISSIVKKEKNKNKSLKELLKPISPQVEIAHTPSTKKNSHQKRKFFKIN